MPAPPGTFVSARKSLVAGQANPATALAKNARTLKSFLSQEIYLPPLAQSQALS